MLLRLISYPLRRLAMMTRSGGANTAREAQPTMPAEKVVTIGLEKLLILGLSHEDLYFRGLSDCFEGEFEIVAQNLIHSDYVCMDIGANIGIKSLLLSQLASHGQIVAIEPSKTVFPVLVTNVNRSGHTNILVRNYAIGAEEGRAKFFDNSAWGYLSSTGHSEVEVKTLSSAIQDTNLQRLDFIKIDVEGFEEKILQAAIKEINAHQALVFFELNSWCIMGLHDRNPRRFLEWIFDNFSQVVRVRRNAGSDFLGILERIDSGQLLRLLHDHLVLDNALTDLIVTNCPDRLIPVSSASRIAQSLGK